MKTMKKLWKKDSVLCISLLLAALSMLLVPPDKKYIQYINYNMLIMLANLISFKLYNKSEGSRPAKYIRISTGTNIILFIVLLVFALIL